MPAKGMPTRSETYADYKARIDSALTASGVADNPVVVSTEIQIATLTDSQNVERTPIAWLLYERGHKMFYITNVPEGSHIKPHAHNEDVFRYLLAGSLVLNANQESFRITPGMWFIVKKNIPYEIKTEEGYRALACYRYACEVKGH